MDEQSRSSCGEQAAVQRRGLLAQTGLTLLCVTMAECLCRTSLSLCAGFSLKVFYLLLHQPVSPGCLLPQTGSRMTHSGGAHAVNERARLCVYKTELLRTCRPLSDVISKSPENLETDFKDEDDVNGRRHTSGTQEKL